MASIGAEHKKTQSRREIAALLSIKPYISEREREREVGDKKKCQLTTVALATTRWIGLIMLWRNVQTNIL